MERVTVGSSCLYVASLVGLMVLVQCGPMAMAFGRAADPTAQGNDFCSRALVPKKSCPTPPTPSSLDLNTLLGSYYEIGSTAHYKLRNELGMACTRTNFTLDASSSSSSSSENIVTVNVLTSGVPVVQGQQTLSALARIASLSSGVCSDAARLCSAAAPQSRLYDANFRIAGAAQRFSASNAPEDASILGQVALTLNASAAGIHSRIERLSRSINVAAGLIASSINQGVGASAALDPVLRAFRASVGVASNDVTELASLLVYNLTFSGSVIDQVLSHIPAEDTSDVRDYLTDALSLINQETDDVIAQVTALQSQLITIQGPLVEMMAADYRTSRSLIPSTGTNLHATSPNASRNSNATVRRGHAKFKDGALTMMMMEDMGREKVSSIEAAAAAAAAGGGGSAAVTSASTSVSAATSTQSLQIIALEGGVPTGVAGAYSVLLAYTCDENNADQDRGPITDLLLLSRTPTLPPPTVIGLINTAASFGIYTDCDNPFVPTIQRPDNCAFL